MNPYQPSDQQPLLQPNTGYPAPPQQPYPYQPQQQAPYGYNNATPTYNQPPVYPQQTSTVVSVQPVPTTTTVVSHHHHSYEQRASRVATIGLILCICCGLFPGGFVWLFGGAYLLLTRKVEGGQKQLAAAMVVLGLMSIIGGILIITLVIVPLLNPITHCSSSDPYSVYASSSSYGTVYVSWSYAYYGTGVCSLDYFEINYRPTTQSSWYTQTAYSSGQYIYGLTSGQMYDIRVRSVNYNGAGSVAYSSWSYTTVSVQ